MYKDIFVQNQINFLYKIKKPKFYIVKFEKNSVIKPKVYLINYILKKIINN